jgi:hypothetical protein
MMNWWTRNSARVDVALVLMILAALAVLLVMIFALPFVGHAETVTP